MAYVSAGSVNFGSQPQITFTVAYELTRDLADVNINIRIKTSAVDGYSYYGYNLYVTPTINGTKKSQVSIKDSYPSQWSSPITTYCPSSSTDYSTTVSDLSATTMPVTLVFGSETGRTKSFSFNAILPNLEPSTVSTASFNIGSNLTGTIDRASTTFKHTLKFYADNTLYLTLTNVGASYTFNTSSLTSQLYALTPNSASLATKIVCTTYNGSTQIGTTTKKGTARVVNSNPLFTTFDVVTDASTQALTGNSNTLIGAYSGVTITVPVANKATAQNSAFMSSYIFGASGQTQTLPYSATANVSASFSKVSTAVQTVTAVDSRGLTTQVSNTLTQLSYVAPVITSLTLQRDNDIDPEVTLSFTGTFWDETFGTQDNTISASWQWKPTTEETWTTGTTPITPTVGTNGEFSFSGYIVNGTSTNWSEDSSYNVQITVTDKITSYTLQGTINVGIPGIYMTKSGSTYSVGINHKPSTANALDVLGNIQASGNATIGGNMMVNNTIGLSGYYLNYYYSGSTDPTGYIRHANGRALYFGIPNGGGEFGILQWFGETATDGRFILRSAENGQPYLGTTTARWNTAYFTNTITQSDLKDKENVQPISNFESFIMALNPIAYTLKDGDSGRVHMGFGAQDVAKAAENNQMGDLALYQAAVVNENGEESYFNPEVSDENLSWGLNYHEFIAPLVAVVQEQQRRIEALEKLINESEVNT